MPAMLRRDPVMAWVVDDTGIISPKKGRGVGRSGARQYCGQVGKQDNCRVAVSLSVTTEKASMPVAFRLYLPVSWVEDRERRKKTGVPDSAQFQTKPEIALEQIRRARERGLPEGVVLADAGYGTDTKFRSELTKLEMTYVVGVQSTTSVWKPGEEPKPAPARKGNTGRPRKTASTRCEQPAGLGERTCAVTTCRNLEESDVEARGEAENWVKSRFVAIRVRPAHRDYWRSQPHPEEWLLIEWPAGEPEPAQYWLSTLPSDIGLRELVHLAKHRWIIERDYQELKQELGLGHYEGRGWRGFHHHATLCIAAYGFLVAERNRFSPSAHVGNLGLPTPNRRPTSGRVVRRVRPERHNPRSITTLRMVLARHLIGGIAQCPFCGSRSG